MSKRLRVWVDTVRTVPFGGIDGYVAEMLAALVPVPPTSIEYMEKWGGDRGWDVTFDVPDDQLADAAMVEWLKSGRARPVPLRDEGGVMGIWGSIKGDYILGWKTGYSAEGEPTIHLDVSVNGSWNDCIRVAAWDDDNNLGGDCMLNRETARALAARLLAAADEVDKRWPA